MIAGSAQTDADRPIGTARMESDGAIVLMLRAEDPARGIIGDSRFVYPPDHPQYDMIKTHVGLSAPGTSAPVRPFPSQPKE